MSTIQARKALDSGFRASFREPVFADGLCFWFVIPFIGKDYIPDIDCEKIGTFLVYLWIIAEFRV